MMSRFAQAARGKGPRHPRTVSPAFLLISAAAVAYSGYFYPQVRLGPVRAAAAQTVTPIRRMVEANPDERITVSVIRLSDIPASDEHTVRLLRRMREIGRRVLREERGQ